MTTWSRRKWLLSGTAVSAGLLAGMPVARTRAQEEQASGGSCRWEDLGIRSEDPSRAVSEASLPPAPRKDGAAWTNKKGLYVEWGQEADVPAEIIRRAFVCRSLVS